MVQIQLINKLLREKSLDVVFNNDLTSSHFSPYTSEFNFIIDHYKQYGNVPDIETFLDNFPEFSIIEVTESDAYLVDKICEDFQYREIVPILNKAAELVQSNSLEATDYLKNALLEIGQLGSATGVDIVADAYIRYDEYIMKKNSTEPWMLPTGFKELDDAIGGLMPGEEFLVIVARTNNGKSWMLAKTLEHNWNMGRNVGYISPEMSASSIGYRFDTLYQHFSNFGLYTGRDVPEYDRYIDDLKEHKNKFIVATPLDFGKKITISKLRKFCLKNKIELLGIDGITYLTDERYKRGDNKTTSLTNISEDLMSLSCELKIPIITVVQANRNGIEENGDVPALESIRDSDGISHNATKVLSIRQKDNKLKMEITKARNCKVGTKLVYDWQIDTGIFEFDPQGGGEFDEPTSHAKSRYEGGRQNERNVENKQPLTRRTTTTNPF